MTFKERKEFEQLEQDIACLEEEKNSSKTACAAVS